MIFIIMKLVLMYNMQTQSLFNDFCEKVVIPAFDEAVEKWNGTYNMYSDRPVIEIKTDKYLLVFYVADNRSYLEIFPLQEGKQLVKIENTLSNLNFNIPTRDKNVLIRCIRNMESIYLHEMGEIGKEIYNQFKNNGMFDDIDNEEENDGE